MATKFELSLMVVKTNQLTRRAIYVYLPTVELANEWKTKADKAKISNF